jgi:hypothetical protein
MWESLVFDGENNLKEGRVLVDEEERSRADSFIQKEIHHLWVAFSKERPLNLTIHPSN